MVLIFYGIYSKYVPLILTVIISMRDAVILQMRCYFLINYLSKDNTPSVVSALCMSISCISLKGLKAVYPLIFQN